MPKVTMPQLGESVAEGTIGKWLKQVGDHVDKYEPIVEVITDKVNAEVPSPFEGTLSEILVQEGQTVPNNTDIAVIDGAGEADAAAASSAAEAPTAAGPVPVAPSGVDSSADDSPAAGGPERTIFGTGHGPAGSDERPVASRDSAGAAPAATPAPPNVTAALTPPALSGTVSASPTASSGGNGTQAGVAEYEGRMTPAVRRLAREHDIDLSLVTGTGHAGRITRDDVMKFVESGSMAKAQGSGATPAAPAAEATAAPSAAAPSAAAPSAAAPSAATQAAAPQAGTAAPVATPSGTDADELKAQTPMRKAIAAHMVKAKQTAPHAYTTVETDMSGVVALREAIKGRYQAEQGTALSFVAIIAKAVVEALRKHPDLNAHWTDDGLLPKRQINLGIAVAVDDGLVVPVVKNADQLSIHGLNLAIQDFATRARSSKLRLDDIQGGTFTLNNTGWFGSVASQPIVNVPEVVIVSMEAIVKRAVVIESPAGDAIAIRPVMNLCTSFDHRATDGAQVGRFVQDVRRWLESVDGSTSIW